MSVFRKWHNLRRRERTGRRRNKKKSPRSPLLPSLKLRQDAGSYEGLAVGLGKGYGFCTDSGPQQPEPKIIPKHLQQT